MCTGSRGVGAPETGADVVWTEGTVVGTTVRIGTAAVEVGGGGGLRQAPPGVAVIAATAGQVLVTPALVAMQDVKATTS